MDDADFDDLLDDYLEGTLFPNMAMAEVEIVWVEGISTHGALHIAQHGVTKDEVEEAIVCDDWQDSGVRYLRPITAFTPDEGRAYCDQQ